MSEFFVKFTKIVIEFWNQPVPIIGFSVGVVALGIIKIINTSSFGRKCYLKYKAWKEEISKEFADYKESKEQQIAEIKEHYEKEKQELVKSLEEKLAIIDNENSDLKNAIIYIGQNINNKYIQAYISDLQAKISTHATELNEIVNQEVEKLKNAYEEKQKELEDKIKEIEEKLNNGNEQNDSTD